MIQQQEGGEEGGDPEYHAAGGPAFGEMVFGQWRFTQLFLDALYAGFQRSQGGIPGAAQQLHAMLCAGRDQAPVKPLHVDIDRMQFRWVKPLLVQPDESQRRKEEQLRLRQYVG